jgi:hypothetical protein
MTPRHDSIFLMRPLTSIFYFVPFQMLIQCNQGMYMLVIALLIEDHQNALEKEPRCI